MGYFVEHLLQLNIKRKLHTLKPQSQLQGMQFPWDIEPNISDLPAFVGSYGWQNGDSIFSTTMRPLKSSISMGGSKLGPTIVSSSVTVSSKRAAIWMEEKIQKFELGYPEMHITKNFFEVQNLLGKICMEIGVILA